MDLYIHSSISLHGLELNLLSTGTTLPLIISYYDSETLSFTEFQSRKKIHSRRNQF
jgi:hypothetical protein